MEFEIRSVMQLIYDLGVAEGILEAVYAEDPGAIAYGAMPYIHNAACFLQKIVFEQYMTELRGECPYLISADYDDDDDE